jgi:CBS domain-containing protein
MRPVATETTASVLVGASTTVQAASAAMLDGGAEAAVVMDGHEIRGLVTADAVARALAMGNDVASTQVSAISEAAGPTVGVAEPLPEVRQRMRAARQPLAIVVDDDRRPVGLLVDEEAAP